MRWLLTVALSAFLMVGCTAQDRDCLSRVGKKLFEQIEETANTSPDPVASGIQAVRGSISGSHLDSRVVLRLRWERDLAGAVIRVRMLNPGAVQLEGFLKEESQRARAVEVARATAGVEAVEEQLRIRETPPATGPVE